MASTASPLTDLPAIDFERLAQISTLAHGSHGAIEDGCCAMEAVAFIAREPWSDHPQCASKVISAFMRAWNDGLPEAERTALLLPLVSRLVGTVASPEVEERRALMALDWLVRTHTPAWLRLAGLIGQAATLEALPEITAMVQVPSTRSPLEAVRKDANAAGDAAGNAAWAAARDAAASAAGVAAGVAAGAAAGDAAWTAASAAAASAAAAWAAAWAAARAAASAAGGAARAKLEPTRKALQRSALQLVERMIALTEVGQ